MKTINVNDFCDILAKRLIDNNVNNGVTAVTRSNLKRLRRATTPELCDHKPAPLQHANGKTRQLRCRWCNMFHEDFTSYTSYKCEDCNVRLCVASIAQALAIASTGIGWLHRQIRTPSLAQHNSAAKLLLDTARL
jgi:hypothetical protein